MACHRGRLLRLCLLASLASISVGLFLLSLLQREHDELDRISTRDNLAPVHLPDRPIVNGQREILEHQQSRGLYIASWCQFKFVNLPNILRGSFVKFSAWAVRLM